MSTTAGVPAQAPVPSTETETDVPERLRCIITEFEEKLSKSQNLKHDLGELLQRLTLVTVLLDKQEEELGEKVSKIENLLEIDNLEGKPLEDRLHAIIEDLGEHGSPAKVEDLADACANIVRVSVLPSADIDLRGKIEAFADETANFKFLAKKNCFEALARARIISA